MANGGTTRTFCKRAGGIQLNLSNGGTITKAQLGGQHREIDVGGPYLAPPYIAANPGIRACNGVILPVTRVLIE